MNIIELKNVNKTFRMGDEVIKAIDNINFTVKISTSNGKSYVKLKDSDGGIKQTEITTGISNDAYTEVKSGLNEGDIVYIEKSTSSNNNFNYRNRQFKENGNNNQGERKSQSGERSVKQNRSN